MSVKLNLDELRQLEVFQDLTDDELRRVNAVMYRQQYAPRTLLFDANDPAEMLYIILSGTVKITQTDKWDSTVILAILGPGQFLGEMAIIDGLGRSATAMTREATVMLRISRSDFWNCLSEINRFAYSVARALSNRVRSADEKIRLLATMDVRTRLARQIITLAGEAGEKLPNGTVRIRYKITQTDLAQMVGATRTRVNQLMRPWKKTKALTVDVDRHIIVSISEMGRYS